MPNAGQLIYSGFVPLMKMGIAIGAGFAIAKKGMFPAHAARGASHIAMDVALPCLVFSSIVPAFNSDNIASLGPLVMNALFYQCCGAAMGLIIREIFWVPDDFQYGIVIACAFSNWGNLPTAIVQTIAKGDPFNPATDPELGVAYVAVFILMYNVTFFGIGLCKICAWDFRPRPERSEIESISGRWRRRGRAMKRVWSRLRGERVSRERKGEKEDEVSMEAVTSYDTEKGDGKDALGYTGGTTAIPSMSRGLSRYQSHQEVLNSTQRHHDTISLVPTRSRTTARGAMAMARHEDGDEDSEPTTPPPAPLNIVSDEVAMEKKVDIAAPTPEEEEEEPKPTTRRAILNFLKLFMTPVTISLFFALPIALVHPLKALFTDVDGWTGTRMPNGPDGRPPLAFLLDTASFIGAICIPTGLILMGASFARLTIPRPFTKLPIGAIVAVTMAKMVVLPVIGVLFTNSLSNTTDLYPKSNKILVFVAMLLSGTPTAANQLVITQIYSPTGSAHTLSSFMALQYCFMFIASSALAAVALSIVSGG